MKLARDEDRPGEVRVKAKELDSPVSHTSLDETACDGDKGECKPAIGCKKSREYLVGIFTWWPLSRTATRGIICQDVKGIQLFSCDLNKGIRITFFIPNRR